MVAHSSIDHTGITGVGGGTPTFVGARAISTAGTSIPNATLTAVPFAQADEYDTSAFHDTATNNTRMIIPTGMAGYYGIGGTLGLASGSATGNRLIGLRLNGTVYFALDIRPGAVISSEQYITIATERYFAVADYIELMYYQSTGAAVNLLTDANYGARFWISRRG